MKIHGKNKKRRWLKIHIGVDAKTQEIVAEATTISCVGDANPSSETFLEEIEKLVHIRHYILILQNYFTGSKNLRR